MYGQNVLKARRITAGFIGILMLVIVLFSSFFIAAEANHKCSGHDCPVCVCIHQCEKTLRQIGDGIITQIMVLIPVILFLISSVLFTCGLMRETLVSQKVRMDN